MHNCNLNSPLQHQFGSCISNVPYPHNVEQLYKYFERELLLCIKLYAFMYNSPQGNRIV